MRQAVEAEGHLPPVRGRRHAGVARCDGPLAAIHLHAEAARRLQLIGLHPAGDAVGAMGLHRHLAHHAAVAVLVHAGRLEPQRRLPLMAHLGVDEAHLARLVVEARAGGAVSLVLLEAAVGDADGRVGHVARLAALHHEQRVLHGNAGGQIAVVGQHGPAVARGEHDGDDLDLVLRTEGLHGGEAPEVLGRLEVQTVEAGREHHAVEAVLGGGAHDTADVLHVLVAAQPARHVDPAVGIHLPARGGHAGNAQGHHGGPLETLHRLHSLVRRVTRGSRRILHAPSRRIKETLAWR